MRLNFIVTLVSMFLVLRGACQKQDVEELGTLKDQSVTNVSLVNLRYGYPYVKHISFAPSSSVTFKIAGTPPAIAFIIFQIHTYQYNVTLSYDVKHLNKVSPRSIFGSNIGLYLKSDPYKPMQMYLKNDNIREVEALLVVTGYTSKAPVPGGCNMEFNTEVAPHQKLVARDGMVIVDAQPASMPITDGVEPNCVKNPVQHEMYQMFLPEQDFNAKTYFSAIQNMLTVEDIMQNGVKIPPKPSFSPMRRVYSAYTGVGSVYVAVSIYDDRSSAYVPTFSYACSPVLYPDSCQTLNGPFPKICCAVIFFMGLYSVLFMSKAACLMPFFIGSLAGYSIAVTYDYATEINIGIGLTTGVLAVLLWLAFQCTNQVCPTLVVSLTPGLLFASAVYLHSQEALEVGGYNWLFWMLFVCVAMAFSLAINCLAFTNIVAIPAIFGSYLMILPFDYYLGSSHKYLMINVIRRMTVPDFGMASVHPPFQGADIGLTVLWVLLALFGTFCWCLPSFKKQSTTFNSRLIPHRIVDNPEILRINSVPDRRYDAIGRANFNVPPTYDDVYES